MAANGSDYRAATIASKIVNVPAARWFGRDSEASNVQPYVAAALKAGRRPVLVAYNIPIRDCGSYSAGGATSAADYRNWIRQFAAGIGQAAAVVVLEPDSLFVTSCLSAAQLTERLGLIKDALSVLTAQAPNAVVYLDGGTPNWTDGVNQMADMLVKAGISGARGFAFNTSNFKSPATSATWAAALAAAVKARSGTSPHFVIDSSRNGGNVDAALWCNPPGAKLGQPPAWSYGSDGLDGTLWLKYPGESDGSCGTAPTSTSGQFVPDLAYSMATN